MSTELDDLKAEVGKMPEEARKGFLEAWGEPEELHPDLRLYTVELPDIGKMVKHPLLFSTLHIAAMNNHANRAYAQKLRKLAEVEDEGKWGVAVFVHERPYRFEAFERMQDFMTDEEYWEVLAHVWTDSENIWQNQEGWEELLSSDRPKREMMMEEGERSFLRLCPAELTVYRGYNREGRADGLSWTHDQGKAEWFANYLCHEPHQKKMLVEGTVRKDDILAIFDGRNENEVVAFPETVFNRKERVLDF